jgi:hypothetical protein
MWKSNNLIYTSYNNTWNQPLPSSGNFWSDYTGKDLNNDGVGDTLYHIIENYTDQYPLMQPANTVQPTTENLLPAETLQVLSPNPSEKPAPSPTSTLPVGALHYETNQTFSVEQVLWVLATLAIIVLAMLVAYGLCKRRKCPSKQLLGNRAEF